MTESSASIRGAFDFLQNAGRSQMADALAGRELEGRGLEEEVSIVTGGT